MEVTLKHGVQYDVTEPVAVEDIIKSIDAHARLVREAGKMLSDLVPGLHIEVGKVSVVLLSQQSPLKEMFAVATVMSYQKELEKEIPNIIEAITGAKISDDYDTIVTVLCMIIAIYGISKAWDVLFPSKPKNNIEETKKSLIERAAKILGVASDRVVAAVEVLFHGKKERGLVSSSQKVFAPTRSQQNAALLDTDGRLLIQAETVRDAQAVAGLPYEGESEDEPVVSSELHPNVRIILHAMDRDRKKSGWAAHCPDLFDERIPMNLEKTISPEKIFGIDELQGDILLTSEIDENGAIKPKDFLLIRAYM